MRSTSTSSVPKLRVAYLLRPRAERLRAVCTRSHASGGQSVHPGKRGRRRLEQHDTCRAASHACGTRSRRPRARRRACGRAGQSRADAPPGVRLRPSGRENTFTHSELLLYSSGSAAAAMHAHQPPGPPRGLACLSPAASSCPARCAPSLGMPSTAPLARMYRARDWCAGGGVRARPRASTSSDSEFWDRARISIERVVYG